ncbi:MAG: hypothetical protein ABSH06_19025 [Thermodesulfobacteriota bacterium]|jgi:hypothetical protein
MKLFQPDFEKSGRLAIQYASFDEENKPTEQDIEKANRKILEAKKDFEEAKIMVPEKVREYFTKLELAEIERRQLLQNYLNAKDKLAVELRAITGPVIEGFAGELLLEFKRIDSKKTFFVIVDKEDREKEGGRIFKCSHNYFSVHETQQGILATVEKIRSMDCSSLGEIKKVYDEMIDAIPDTFEMTTTEGTSEFRTWIFDNQPNRIKPAEVQTVWLHHTQFLADLEKKVQDFEAKAKDGEVGELVKKHRGPIEIDMT